MSSAVNITLRGLKMRSSKKI